MSSLANIKEPKRSKVLLEDVCYSPKNLLGKANSLRNICSLDVFWQQPEKSRKYQANAHAHNTLDS